MKKNRKGKSLLGLLVLFFAVSFCSGCRGCSNVQLDCQKDGMLWEISGKEIFFMIRTGENDTFIIPVDKKLKPVEADYHYYSGDTAQLLRSINSIKEEMAFESEATDVSLSQNPHLLYQLIRCRN